ncbi:MAG: hypothetical protein L6R19_08430 [Alphaproteobacteria bacterium]|nr:hypothetical protein [Alphaproteobacteria bacterium]
MTRRRAAVVGLVSALALAGAAAPGPAWAQQRGRDIVSGIAKLPLPERPQRSKDMDQETLALQFVESVGMRCRGIEMYRWRFDGDEAERAQRLIAAGEKGLKDRGYDVTALPVEVDAVTALQARHAGRNQPDANVIALWYASDEGLDLTLCRVQEK